MSIGSHICEYTTCYNSKKICINRTFDIGTKKYMFYDVLIYKCPKSPSISTQALERHSTITYC